MMVPHWNFQANKSKVQQTTTFFFQELKKVEKKMLLFINLIFFRPVLRVNRDSQVSCTQFTSQVFDLQLDWKNSG